MRHRSVIAFILLAAILVAVPQASQDLLALKSALGERVRNEIWHAFLNLNSQGGEVQAAPRQRAEATLAACPAGASKSASQKAGGAKKGSASDSPATTQGGAASADNDARGAELGQLAMMLTPPAGTSEGKTRLEAVEGVNGFLMGKVLNVPSRTLSTAEELAMIIPPEQGVDVTSLDRRDAARVKESKALRQRAHEFETHASFTAARFGERTGEFKKPGEAIRFHLNYILKDANAVRAPEAAPRARLTKLKRERGKTVTAPAASAGGQAKQLACLVSEPNSWEATLFSSGE